MGKPVEKKKKKKGRPSLLDLQKRSLRLQKQQDQHHDHLKRNPNPSHNPYARFPNPSPLRLTHRSRIAGANPNASDDEDEDEPGDRRKEKKLKLVVNLPPPDANSSDSPFFPSESDIAAAYKRKIDAQEKSDSKLSSKKATEVPQGGASVLGPATPLPDKTLLEFILDRLQKKDTYGVFSEPVESDELPDYHDIIKHPMDFGTVRKKLFSGVYKTLEQFEKDVFLISSNAMRYNSSDTIYFRQARSIHELAKKSFENLRQESDDNELEPEPKIVRRGRPPGIGKSNARQSDDRLSAERAGPEFFDAPLANNEASNESHPSIPRNDFSSIGPGFQNPGGLSASPARPVPCFPSFDAYMRRDHKSERSEDLGNAFKVPSKQAKKPPIMDESGRDAFRQCQLAYSPELPLRGAPSGVERKFLVPVGLHVERAYARSLARFAANLGPIAWNFAAKRIEKALPPGTKFGHGWVAEPEAQSSHLLPPSYSRPNQSPHLLPPTRSDQSSEARIDVPFPEQDRRLRTSSSSSSPLTTTPLNRFINAGDFKPSSHLPPLANGFKPPLFRSNSHQFEPFASPNANLGFRQ